MYKVKQFWIINRLSGIHMDDISGWDSHKCRGKEERQSEDPMWKKTLKDVIFAENRSQADCMLTCCHPFILCCLLVSVVVLYCKCFVLLVVYCYCRWNVTSQCKKDKRDSGNSNEGDKELTSEAFIAVTKCRYQQTLNPTFKKGVLYNFCTAS